MSSPPHKHDKEFTSGRKNGPEVGTGILTRLTQLGFHDARNLLKHYFIIDGDESRFVHWLKESVQVNQKQAEDCCNCIRDWCKESFGFSISEPMESQQMPTSSRETNRLFLTRLKDEGLDDITPLQAMTLIKQYLILGGDENSFFEWYDEYFKDNIEKAKNCCNIALRD